MLYKWILLQLVIQLIPSLANGIVVYVIKTVTSEVELDISILIFTSAANDLLSLLKKKFELDNPEINQIDNNILIDVIKDSKDIYFHTFEYRCVYDIKFEDKTSGEVFHFKVTNSFKLFSSQSDILH